MTPLFRRPFLLGWTLLCCVVFSDSLWAQTPEFRAFWVDAWGTGFQNASQVNTLTNDLRTGNFNAVIPQVRRRGDAFYNGVYEPKNAGLSPSFDPLADLIAKCHNTAYGPKIEVHAWIVTYHIWQGANPPPQPTHPLNLHPDWLMEDVNGNKVIDNEYTFDPGHPEVQRHTFNVAMSIITNYNVDGLNFDYIRYSSINDGYNPVTVARFNQRYARTGKPSPSDELWKQFRRDQVTALLRKVYLNALAVKPQVKISCDTITWAPGPTSISSWYSSSAAWNSVLQDWRGWMEEGILDWNFPMNYFAQSGAYTVAWTNWNNFIKDHQYGRYAANGPGIYLNSTADAITQMRYSRVPSSSGNTMRGIIGYSYRVPNNDGVSRANFINALVNPSAYDPVAPPIFSQPVSVPEMPWKTAPTKGHLMGNITGNFATNFLDGATVSVSGPVNRSQINDATGFYGFVDLPPGDYTVTASFAGYQTAQTSVTISPGVVSTRNFNLFLVGPPEIAAQPQSRTNYVGTSVNFTVSATGAGVLDYQWLKDGAVLPAATNATYTIASITTNDAADYTVIISNNFGTVTSAVATLTVIVPPPNLRSLPLWEIPANSRTNVTSDVTERGLGFNPVNNHLLLVSRANAANNIYVLNATDGSQLYSLNLGSGIITGGTFPVNMIGVADDGAVYVGNLTTAGATTAFRLYRWANDDPGTIPTLAYSGNPISDTNERWGDTLAVRGSGLNTQILIGSRSGTNAVIFTTVNGTTFSPNPIAVNGGANSMFGLGIAFGHGDTFWGKVNSGTLRQISFNLANGTGTIIQSFPGLTGANAIAPIGISTALNLLGGIAIETPDSLKLYDLPLVGTPSLIETNTFPTDNANANAVGSVVFGGDRVFALNCQNGIIAVKILPPTVAPSISQHPESQVVKVGSNVTFSVTADGTPAPAYQWYFNGAALDSATSPDLLRSNTQLTDAGDYFVVVSNIAGVMNSSTATLSVLPLAPLRFENINPLPDGTMALMISGEPGYPFAIERSTNFTTWLEITNVTNPTGIAGVIDHDATNQPVGFYRARQ